MILAMWSAPRCRSTAFERMMMQRGDFLVVHEPFSHVANFGLAEVASTTVNSERMLIDTISTLSGDVFFKDTTDFYYPELLADQKFLQNVTHTFIIRHPAEAIASHFALNAELQRDEIGFAWLCEIFDAVRAATGAVPVVIDSDDLIDRPAATVEAYCASVGITFRPEALRWRPAEPDQWQRTARWHRGASESSGFSRDARRAHPAVADHPVLGGYYRYHLPFYQRLWEHRLIVE